MNLFKTRQRNLALIMLLAAVLPAVSGCAAMASRQAPDQQSEQLELEAGRRALARGDRALQAGDGDKALMEYVTALQAEPESASIRYRIGLAHELRNDMPSAKQAYRDAVALDATHAGALEGLGLSLLRDGRQEEARDYLQKALANDSSLWRSYNGLGILEDLARNSEAAQAHYSSALGLRPEQPEVLNNMGYSFYLAGDFSAAQGWFERALKGDNRNATAWSNLALVRVRLGNAAGGVEAFSEITEPHRAYNNVGYLLYKVGDYEAAREYLEKAISLSPAYYALATENLTQVESARLQ